MPKAEINQDNIDYGSAKPDRQVPLARMMAVALPPTEESAAMTKEQRFNNPVRLGVPKLIVTPDQMAYFVKYFGKEYAENIMEEMKPLPLEIE